MGEIRHVPVLVREVLDYLQCRSGKIYVDGTLGRGGHASAILERSSPDGKLIGLDWDGEAVDRARESLAPFGSRAELGNKNYKDLPGVLESLAIPGVDGILLDLGISTEQLENGDRGFSFRVDGPLDMRMSHQLKKTAADLLRHLPADTLTQIIREYGEERWARRIARRIVEERKRRPLRTTKDLAEIIARSVPYSSGRIHPATRTFQALRIQVNEELANLEAFLEKGPELLNPSGRLGIISFHSLEDRIVKNHFRRWARPPQGGRSTFQIVTRKPVIPSAEEITSNPRARSAKLRVLERIREDC